MSMISLHAPLPLSIRETASTALARTPRRLRLLAAAAMLLMAGNQLSLALQSPAQSIRSALTAAADEAAALPWNRNDQQVQRAIGQHFTGRDVRVETARFPAEVAVVLADLDRETCIEARELTHRIEGDVVIALDGYGSVADCRARNTMTWRILP
ncbi:MAG TPA: hypothetical protein VEI03_23990 [Stellaceae bacterium]|nr:hypothetical protein [Stellaceae bacterium]